MNFNFGGFLAGMSESVVGAIEEEKEQQRRFELMAEEEATKERARRKAKRETENAALEELTESLKLYYTDDQVADILSNGKVAGNYALSHGQTVAANGGSASASYTMPKGNMASQNVYDPSNPNAKPHISQSVTAGTFADRFTLNKKERSKADTFQERLVELTWEINNATTPEEKEKATNTYGKVLESYRTYKTDLAKEAAAEGKEKPAIDFLDETRQQNIIESSFENVLMPYTQLYVKDPKTQFLELKSGNEASIIHLQAENYLNLKTTYLDAGLADEGTTFYSRIKQTGRQASTAKRSYVEKIKREQTAAEESARDAGNNIGLSEKSMKYYALQAGQKRTFQEVEKGRANGTFNMGSVVEYIDANGNVRTAMVSQIGVY